MVRLVVEGDKYKMIGEAKHACFSNSFSLNCDLL
jgi:hypothetical protein